MALAVLLATIPGAAVRGATQAASAATPTIEAAGIPAGPYATTTSTVTDSAGNITYYVYRPADYGALGFLSPIVTWGDGTKATPGMYSDLLTHFASYGLTVIALNKTDTGSGIGIAAGVSYLVTASNTPGNVFSNRLDPAHVAAVGHSQGASGAVRAASNNPSLITAVLTFSLPDSKWDGANTDCPTAADCSHNTALLTQPTFLLATHGLLDSVIAPPATEKADFNAIPGHAVLGLIKNSGGKSADHNSVQDSGNPTGEYGYATEWLEYELRGTTSAARAFTNPNSEIASNTNWPGSAVK